MFGFKTTVINKSIHKSYMLKRCFYVTESYRRNHDSLAELRNMGYIESLQPGTSTLSTSLLGNRDTPGCPSAQVPSGVPLSGESTLPGESSTSPLLHQHHTDWIKFDLFTQKCGWLKWGGSNPFGAWGSLFALIVIRSTPDKCLVILLTGHNRCCWLTVFTDADVHSHRLPKH